MTHQLELAPVQAAPAVRPLLFEASLAGEPQRSKSHPRIRGGRITMQADDAWAAYRVRAISLLRPLWRGRESIVVPVVVEVVAVFSRPQAPRRHYTVKGERLPYPWPWTNARVPFVGTPDWDQVGKAAVDVCVQAGILADDPLVVEGRTTRWYAAAGEGPSVTVCLWGAL